MTSTAFELGNDGPNTVLVGIDGSPTSLRAASYAIGLARRQGAHLICLYVRQPAGTGAQDATVVSAGTDAQNALATEISNFVDEARTRDKVQISMEVRTGDPTREIARTASDLHVDAVVVGASSKAGHHLIGWTGSKLIRAARWPVTVVP